MPHFAASDLGLHCLLSPVCPNIYGYYSIVTEYLNVETKHNFCINCKKWDKRKVQGMPQSQTAALPINQEEEETDKTKQAQIEQTYEKH